MTYGLYGQIIHQDFMAHSLVTDILYEHCVQGELSFTDAMDYLDSECIPYSARFKCIGCDMTTNQTNQFENTKC